MLKYADDSVIEANCEAVCSKGHQHQLFLSDKLKLDDFSFYHAVIESVSPFCLVSWFGNLSL